MRPTTRGQLLRRAAGVALGASLLGRLPPPVAAAPVQLTTGEVAVFGGHLRPSIPAGWLPCDGRRVAMSAYPDLARALNPDGSDLFGTGPYGHPTRTFVVDDEVTLPFLVGHIIKAEHSGKHDHSALAGMPVGGHGPTRIVEQVAQYPHFADVPTGTLFPHAGAM